MASKRRVQSKETAEKIKEEQAKKKARPEMTVVEATPTPPSPPARWIQFIESSADDEGEISIWYCPESKLSISDIRFIRAHPKLKWSDYVGPGKGSEQAVKWVADMLEKIRHGECAGPCDIEARKCCDKYGPKPFESLRRPIERLVVYTITVNYA